MNGKKRCSIYFHRAISELAQMTIPSTTSFTYYPGFDGMGRISGVDSHDVEEDTEVLCFSNVGNFIKFCSAA